MNQINIQNQTSSSVNNPAWLDEEKPIKSRFGDLALKAYPIVQVMLAIEDLIESAKEDNSMTAAEMERATRMHGALFNYLEYELPEEF